MVVAGGAIVVRGTFVVVDGLVVVVGGGIVVGGAVVVVGGRVVVLGGGVVLRAPALHKKVLQQLNEQDLTEPPRDWFTSSHAWFSMQKESRIHPFMKMGVF